MSRTEGDIVQIRVQRPNQDIATIEPSGEWRAEPVERNCLVGPVHFLTPEGYYDHEAPRAEHAGSRRRT